MSTVPAATASEIPTARDVVRNIGAVLLVVGGIQAVVALFNAQQGQLRVEVLGLVVGLLIFFGNMRVIAVVRWLAWSALIPLAYGLVSPFIVAPLELTLLQLRLYPGQMLPYFLIMLLNLALTCLVARQLGHPAVLEARTAAGRKLHNMRIPLVLGAIGAAILAVVTVRALGSEDAQRAEHIAAAQLGSGYQYYTNWIHFSAGGGTSRVQATVQAWNDKEVLAVPVQWIN